MPDPVVYSGADPGANEQGAYASASWHTEPPPPPPRKSSPAGWGRITVCIFVLLLQAVRVGIRIFHPKKISAQVPWRHGGVIVRPDQLSGTGRIYLVQLGSHKDPYTVVELATWLRERYSLDTQILPAMPLDDTAYDHLRHLYIAEKINEQIRRDHPDLAADPNSVIIGFTDAEMYSITERRSDTFSQRDSHRTAIISSADMGRIRSTQQSKTLEDRLRRILLKDVAIIFWHLPLNNDPGSVLYYRLDPYLPAADIYQSDLDPLNSPWGLYIADPCIVFIHTPGTTIAATTPLIQQCSNPESKLFSQETPGSTDAPPDTSQERVELRLAYGLLTEKHTDFYLPGPVPIRFERALNDQWQMPSAFGMSGSHNYDRYLVSHDDMRHIAIANAGTGDIALARSPSWLSMLSLNKWIDSDLSGYALTLRWRTQPEEHFELTRFNGEIESYLPCNDSEVCYLNGYQDTSGQKLTFTRDGQRNLVALSAPQNNWLHLAHDGNSESKMRVTEIVDSHGRSVQYAYNAAGQLTEVVYPSSEAVTYSYNNSQNLVALGARLPGGQPLTLMTNGYENGRLISQTLADGSTYTYSYRYTSDTAYRRVRVTTPGGTIYDIAFGRDGAAVRASKSQPDAQAQRP